MQPRPAERAPAAPGHRSRALARREALWGFAFISPWIIGLVLFTAGPVLAAFYFGFTDYPILSAPQWIGLANYAAILQDPLFLTAIENTLYFVLIRVPLHLVVAFVLALLVSRPLRGIKGLRTLIYFPSMAPLVSLALMWRALLDSRSGYVNYYLSWLLGLPQIDWLTSESLIKPAIIGMSLWDIGIAMVVFLAGIQGIPDQLYEAAEIDGANGWRRLLAVTIPMMTPVILFNLIIDVINSFQVFAYAYILTDGGPVNASLFYVLYIYRMSFEQFKMGYASALAVILFVAILICTTILMRSSDQWVQYERI